MPALQHVFGPLLGLVHQNDTRPPHKWDGPPERDRPRPDLCCWALSVTHGVLVVCWAIPQKKKVVCWAATSGSPHKLACFVNALSLCCYRIVFLEKKEKEKKRRASSSSAALLGLGTFPVIVSKYPTPSSSTAQALVLVIQTRSNKFPPDVYGGHHIRSSTVGEAAIFVALHCIHIHRTELNFCTRP